ncbi:hypothetical protein AB4Z54_33645, partial [Streptomyces sp. MCAF7]
MTVRAEPLMQTPALRAVRGRPAGKGSGLEQVQSHTPQASSNTAATTWTHQSAVNPVSRYPRPGVTGHTDREGPSVALTNTRSRTRQSGISAEDRLWTRTDSAADFDDIDYAFTASVRSQLIAEWPANIPGGLIQAGLLSFSGLNGNVAARLIAGARRLLSGRPANSVTVPAAAVLRFVGSEAVEPREHDGPRPPALLTQDPLAMSPQQALAQGTPPFPANSRLVPTWATPVLDFNAFPQLTEALHTVAPDLASSWGLPAGASAETSAARLGELVQAGDISVDLPRAAAGLTPRMPGSWPLETPGVAPALSVSLHNPRPVTDSGDVAVDRVRTHTRT